MTLEDFEQPARRNALAFTILVHTGLIAALILGVQWKRSPSDLVEVELWSNRPTQAVQAAAPPPPPPEAKPEPIPEAKPLPKAEPKPEPPPPQKPDIAIKEEKKPPKPEPKKPEPPKPEPKKPEPPKPEPKKPEPPKPEVKPEPKAPDFSELLKREAAERSPRPNASQQMAKAAAAEAEQRATAVNQGLQAWSDKVSRHIRQYVVLPNGIQGNPQAVFELRVLPSGDVLQPIKLKKSSGNSALDLAAERAIIKASPLPKPDSGSFPNPLEIKYKPFEE